MRETTPAHQIRGYKSKVRVSALQVLQPALVSVAEWRDEFPSSPALFPKEKGAENHVP